MKEQINLPKLGTLPIELESFGQIVEAKQIIPGVYEAVVNLEHETDSRKVYIVLRNAPDISDEAKRHGQSFPEHPELLFYWTDSTVNTHYIILYEIGRYQILRQPDRSAYTAKWPMREIATYGAELNPAYFGEHPIPFSTPWGLTLRNKVLAHGIYWLETEKCEQGLVSALPLNNNFSDEVRDRACTMDEYRCGRHSPLYLFFREADACIALYELLLQMPEGMLAARINRLALENAVFKNHPKYADRFNKNLWIRLQGALDYSSLSQGKQAVKKRFAEEKLHMTPEAGTVYLQF